MREYTETDTIDPYFPTPCYSNEGGSNFYQILPMPTHIDKFISELH